jgi:hypothetical protein
MVWGRERGEYKSPPRASSDFPPSTSIRQNLVVSPASRRIAAAGTSKASISEAFVAPESKRQPSLWRAERVLS